MEEKTQISIIIPIFKAQCYIEKCVRSLFEQTIVNGIEFIFVDDHSPDDSLLILNDILEMYPKRKLQSLILSNNRNMGAAYSKIRGLKESKGEYIGWCDSDDWIEKDMYEKMWNASDNGKIDIVMCEYIKETTTKKQAFHLKTASTPNEALEKSWEPQFLPSELPIQLTKRHLLLDAVEEITHTSQGEDTYIKRHVFQKAKTIAYVKEQLYHYNANNSNSLTHNPVRTKEEWLLHKKNIDKIESQLYTSSKNNKKYRLAVNYLKLNRKNQYCSAFNSIFDFYHTYRECYNDINTLTHNKGLARIKTYLLFNCYPLFYFYYRKRWKDFYKNSNF